MERKSKTWKENGKPFDWATDTINKDNLVDALLKMKLDNITYNFINETFGSFGAVQLANSYDIMIVPKGAFEVHEKNEKEKPRRNTKEFETTLGLWIFNIVLRDCYISPVVGYINESVTSNVYGKIETAISEALIEDRIDTDILKNYENTLQWFMWLEDILSPNHTEKLLACTKVIDKKKDELIKKYKAEIDAGNIEIAEKMEKELLDFAQEYLGDDPSFDTILSGAGSKFGNDFKNMYVMRGAIKNPDPNAERSYNIVTGNYLDGIPADEYSIIAGAGTNGAYSRGKKTQSGGYYEKLFDSAYQYLQLDPPGSDCGTDKYITVDFKEQNIDDYMYSYIIKSNGNLECLTSKNKDQYRDKKVKMRFASMCKSKTGICNKCAGEFLYSLGIKNIGMVMNQIPSTLKVKCMKAFHDSIVHTVQMDPWKAFYPFEDE